MDERTLILASQSPRRREFLRSLGLAFVVDAPNIDESVKPGESAEAFVRRIAQEKCAAIAAKHPGRPVLSADTEVSALVGDAERIFGKPESAEDACAMLASLQGRAHSVMTAFRIVDGGGNEVEQVVVTEVEFVPLLPAEILAYVNTGEPMDKAGGYGVQGGAARFVRRINGSYTNIVGLPLSEVYEALKRLELL